MRQLITAALLLVAVAATAHADSDGYFCVGKDYIAYQFGLAAPPVAPHRLTIVRFRSTGFQAPQLVELPQFQVHGMNCGDSTIKIAAFDSIYTIALTPSPHLVGRVAIPVADRGHFPTGEFVQRNLGSWARLGPSRSVDRMVLGRAGDGRQFELVITPTASPRPCALNLVSALVETDASGTETARREVFRGEKFLECGGGTPAA